MGKTFTRNPNDENYSGNVRGQRKANKQDRNNRHKREDVLEANMEQDETFGKHSDDFRPRRDDW